MRGVRSGNQSLLNGMIQTSQSRRMREQSDSSLHQKPKSEPQLATGSVPQRPERSILLLQGPVGPVFNELHRELVSQDFSVKRVLFHAGDAVFSRRGDCLRFAGTLEDWRVWLHEELSRNPDYVIVLFGSMRPVHQAARQVAAEYGIPVLSLEEGYLRAGFITCELGGNNQHSQLCSWTLQHKGNDKGAPALALRSSFPVMSFWGAVHYLARDTFSSSLEQTLFHRERERFLPLSLSWIRHSMRRGAARITEASKLNRIVRDTSRHYILVPLQVPSDSQIKTAARGWTNEKLIESALAGLAQASGEQELMFKLHPLDRGGLQLRDMIVRQAKALGLCDRVHVFQTGKLGDLTKRAAGMIVINSTSAFSALHHHIPVLVMGKAIFRHPDIVTVGECERDLHKFFRVREVKRAASIKSFLSDVRNEALLPGDFYRSNGRAVAVKEIVSKVEAIVASSRDV